MSFLDTLLLSKYCRFEHYFGVFGVGLGGLGGPWGGPGALGGHVGGNLAPRFGFTDFWTPPGWPKGPMLGPTWRHVAAKLGHFGVSLEIKWTFLGIRSRAST